MWPGGNQRIGGRLDDSMISLESWLLLFLGGEGRIGCQSINPAANLDTSTQKLTKQFQTTRTQVDGLGPPDQYRQDAKIWGQT